MNFNKSSVLPFSKRISPSIKIMFLFGIINPYPYSSNNLSGVKASGLWTPSEIEGSEGGHAMCIIGYDNYKYGGALGLKSQAGGKWVAIRLIGDMKDSFEKALSLKPNHLEARWALIEYYLQVPGLFGGSEKKAQNYANQLMTFSPIDGYLARGKIDEYFERFKSAENNYLKAIQIGGTKTTYDRLTALYKVKLLQFY